MESRSLVLLLVPLLVSSGCSHAPAAFEAEADPQPVVIEPEIERREIDPPRVRASNFELGLFAGQISVEDFGVGTAAGARLAYHVAEGLFLELAVGRADAEETSFELLSGAAPLLTDGERRYTYYNVSAGYDVLPGEIFLGRQRAMNSALYVIGGIGATAFAGDDRFTLNLGAGVRVVPFDRFALYAEVRDHIFEIDTLGRSKHAQNIQSHIGFTYIF